MIDGLVIPAFLHGEQVSAIWHFSMMELYMRDMLGGGQLLGPPLSGHVGTQKLPEGRNQCCRHFLDETPGEWLWFIDTDMGFGPDIVQKLVDAADPVERPIVGGLCFGYMLRDENDKTTNEFYGRELEILPTMYLFQDGQLGRFTDYPDDELVQVSATGAACLLIHRDVLAKMRAEIGDRWFHQLPHPDREYAMTGEDIAFCAKAAKAEVPIYVHTGAKTSHEKIGSLTEVAFRRERAALKAMEAESSEDNGSD